MKLLSFKVYAEMLSKFRQNEYIDYAGNSEVACDLLD